MKFKLLLTALVLSGKIVTAQNTFPENGNAGVGTLTPEEKLTIYGINNSLPGVVLLATSIENAGYVEVGAIKAKNSGAEVARIGMLRGGGSHTGFLNFSVKASNTTALAEAMRITEDGHVGIGTATPRETLSVNGKVRAQEVKVEATNWPDYVFEDKYKIKPLPELEAYIRQNKHLPEMPSRSQVEKDGAELGFLTKHLLKNQEELTLHLIEQNKQIENLVKKVMQQQLEIEQLKAKK